MAAVTGSLSMLGHRQRIEGFRQVMAEEFPGITVAEIAENNDDDAESAKIVSDIMNRVHPRGLYFGAAGAAAGARQAKELASGPLSIVVSDPIPEIRDLIHDNIVQAAIGQQPEEQGYQAMRLMIEHLIFHTKPAQDCIYTQNEIKIKTNL